MSDMQIYHYGLGDVCANMKEEPRKLKKRIKYYLQKVGDQLQEDDFETMLSNLTFSDTFIENFTDIIPYPSMCIYGPRIMEKYQKLFINHFQLQDFGNVMLLKSLDKLITARQLDHELDPKVSSQKKNSIQKWPWLENGVPFLPDIPAIVPLLMDGHYSLFVFYNKRCTHESFSCRPTILHMDSIKNSSHMQFYNHIRQYFKDVYSFFIEDMIEPKLVQVPSLPQPNAVDCGFYTLFHVMWIIQAWEDLHFDLRVQNLIPVQKGNEVYELKNAYGPQIEAMDHLRYIQNNRMIPSTFDKKIQAQIQESISCQNIRRLVCYKILDNIKKIKCVEVDNYENQDPNQLLLTQTQQSLDYKSLGTRQAPPTTSIQCQGDSANEQGLKLAQDVVLEGEQIQSIASNKILQIGQLVNQQVSPLNALRNEQRALEPLKDSTNELYNQMDNTLNMNLADLTDELYKSGSKINSQEQKEAFQANKKTQNAAQLINILQQKQSCEPMVQEQRSTQQSCDTALKNSVKYNTLQSVQASNYANNIYYSTQAQQFNQCDNTQGSQYNNQVTKQQMIDYDDTKPSNRKALAIPSTQILFQDQNMHQENSQQGIQTQVFQEQDQIVDTYESQNPKQAWHQRDVSKFVIGQQVISVNNNKSKDYFRLRGLDPQGRIDDGYCCICLEKHKVKQVKPCTTCCNQISSNQWVLDEQQKGMQYRKCQACNAMLPQEFYIGIRGNHVSKCAWCTYYQCSYLASKSQDEKGSQNRNNSKLNNEIFQGSSSKQKRDRKYNKKQISPQQNKIKQRTSQQLGPVSSLKDYDSQDQDKIQNTSTQEFSRPATSKKLFQDNSSQHMQQSNQEQRMEGQTNERANSPNHNNQQRETVVHGTYIEQQNNYSDNNTNYGVSHTQSQSTQTIVDFQLSILDKLVSINDQNAQIRSSLENTNFKLNQLYDKCFCVHNKDQLQRCTIDHFFKRKIQREQ